MAKYLLARLAGGQADILKDARTDRVRYTAMGGVLLTTAAVAGVSASFALNTAVGLSTNAAIVAGVLWAVVIFNLDRMLIVSMTRQSGWVRNILAVVPRIALAIVIGAIISVPLVLRIFQPEIDFQLQKMHNTNLTEVQAGLQQAYSQIDTLQQQVDQLQLVASGQQQPSVQADPNVAALQQEVATAQAAATAAADKAQCELVGSCGTMVPGQGEAYRQAEEQAKLAQQTLDDARARLEVATTEAQARIESAAASNKTTAQQQLEQLLPQLQALRDDYAVQQGKNIDAESDNQGLLARLAALDALSESNQSQKAANQALFLLFMLIELLPVLVKLLSLIGPPTLYDKLLEKRERSLEANVDRVATELDAHRMDEQIRQGKEANTHLVETQSKIAEKAIDVWGQIAMSRSDEELRRWYAQHAGASTGTPSSVTSSSARQPNSAAGGAQAAAPSATTPGPVTTPITPVPAVPAPAPAVPASATTAPTPVTTAPIPVTTVPVPTASPLPAPTPATGGAQTYQQYRAAVGGVSGNGHAPVHPPANP